AYEADRRRNAEDMAALADLVEDERRLARELEAARIAGGRRRLAELGGILARDDQERALYTEYCAERERLAGLPHVPADLAERLQRAAADRESGSKSLERLATEREREITAPRREAHAELDRLAAFGRAVPGKSDESRVLERELERAALQVTAAREKQAVLDAELRARGVEPARLRELHERFGRR